MAARRYALLERRRDNVEILLQGILARHVELQKYMVVRAGSEYARFLKSHVLHQLEVLFVRADPPGDLRKTVASLNAESNRFPVLFRIEKELGLADHAVR